MQSKMNDIYELANSLKNSPELILARKQAEESRMQEKLKKKHRRANLKRKKRVPRKKKSPKFKAVKFRMIYCAIKEEMLASGFSLRMIRNKGRSDSLTESRDRLIWRAKKETDYPTEILAEFFGKSSPGILNSCKNHEERLQSGEQIEELK